MSTTIKRVALVAVAALGLGVIASAPSNAAPAFAYTTIGDAAAGQALIGGQAVVSLTPDTNTSTIVSVSGVGAVVSTSEASTVYKVGSSLVQWTDSSTVNSATTGGAQQITLYSAVAGVTTITATPLGADGSPGTAKTTTVTWVSSLAKNSVANSVAYIQGTNNNVAAANLVTGDSTTAELSFDAALNTGTSKAVIWLRQFTSSDTSTESTLASGKGADIKVEISGAGTLGTSSGAATGSVVTVLGSTIGGSTTGATKLFYVFSDGRPGPATITITSGTKVITKTIKFVGAVASYKVSADADYALSKNYIGVGETATVAIDSFDSLGNRVTNGVTSGLTTTNETSTVATMNSAANGSTKLYTITGVAVGDARIKVSDGTYSTYVSIAVTKKTIASYKVAFDKTSYAPGEKVTWTITATDSNGKPVADGARALFGSVASNLSVSNGSLFGTSPEFVDGVATGSFYAPAAASGKFEVTVSQGAADDVRIAALAAATAAGTAAPTAVKTVYGFDIVNAAADAATEAANDAAQAASDATDAALAAADAADEATSKAQEAVDAVATLSAEVSKMITALKAQIKTLSNLVTKIAKKVKA
jgi:hypothetical protein